MMDVGCSLLGGLEGGGRVKWRFHPLVTESHRTKVDPFDQLQYGHWREGATFRLSVRENSFFT